MQYKDYYKTLGVARTATADEIKRAYRRLARKFHPDVSKEPDAENRFKEINEANEVLHDPKKRAAYDALGSNWRAGQEFRPPPGAAGNADFNFNAGDTSDFSDFIANMFGRAFRSESREPLRRRRGQDQTLKVTITLEDAYRGTTRQIRLDVQNTNSNQTVKSRTLNVRIPEGVVQGQQIRLAGQGAAGVNNGAAGDLYLEIEIAPHPYFTVEGKDMQLRLPITPWEAALGAAVTVPTLGGAVTLKIPAGSQTGRKMRLKGRGLPGQPPGDVLILLEIVTPPATTATAQDFYRQMAERLPFNPRAELDQRGADGC
ncbi:DnaJ C-terminal domain-containing protein [Chromatium okenii]|jgi:curved DNA-binding protein|uniref:Cytochrome C biogenesis protein n=1 Tax=Chromatium okenii TaxID=61644 RepID=A0A2S7XV93_9GAMM|nr:DnaJ C-terminal domain-containing protein [Chromatium okenii]MBV5311265.1 DnaJ domain-containing protein [Chromatium okenii]PQJ95162.1 cytochrome C biogenesis protein [Chromatium okenii]PQJ97654.1 cytochrome C biogenesis protein [Chromatium okenii]